MSQHSEESAARVRVLRSEELLPGELREVRVRNLAVMVGRLRSGEVMAAAALCPHESARLAEGTMRGDAVDCPRHHYLFDLRDGSNLYPYPIYPEWKKKEVGDLSLQLFQCREESGWVLVPVDEEGRPTPA